MSIPLDRLYNFLDTVSDHELIIYGFRPHGSKNLKNLDAWRNIPPEWKKSKILPTLIFHDQEPLDYDFSSFCVEHEYSDIVKNWRDWNDTPQGPSDGLARTAPLMQEFYKKMHLRSVLETTFYDQSIIVHSEKNSAQVNKFEQNNFVPVYYWSHALIARDWFRFAEHDPLLKLKNNNPKTFLIYNRAWSGTREYRLKFIELLVNSGLQESCITSFSATDNQNYYTAHKFKNPQFITNRQDLEKVLEKNIHDSAASADYNNQDYSNSQIEVVLETLFDDTRNHLTEKSLRPIACGQPFIIASTPGSLQYLREYGFKTFNGYIDETYDTIVDPLDRLNAIITEMQRIDNLTPDQKQQLLTGVKSIVTHNQQLFFSKEFHHHIVDEFKQNLNQGINNVKAGSIGNNLMQSRALLKTHYPELFFKFLNQNPDDIKWTDQWLSANVKS